MPERRTPRQRLDELLAPVSDAAVAALGDELATRWHDQTEVRDLPDGRKQLRGNFSTALTMKRLSPERVEKAVERACATLRTNGWTVERSRGLVMLRWSEPEGS
jgi:hypothetical protein